MKDKEMINPFRDDLIIIPKRKTISGVDSNRVIRDKSAGVEQPIKFSYNIIQDDESFVKIYKDNVKNMFDLSLSASKVFWFTCVNLRFNNDIVNIEKDEFMIWSGYKNRKSFYDGLKELIEKKLLAETDSKNWYWINPAVFFNGNRMEIKTVFYKK